MGNASTKKIEEKNEAQLETERMELYGNCKERCTTENEKDPERKFQVRSTTGDVYESSCHFYCDKYYKDFKMNIDFVGENDL